MRALVVQRRSLKELDERINGGMKAIKGAFALSIMLLASAQARAGERPSFNLEHCAWHATDIVLASEGEAIDGRLIVLKVLAGGLNIGDSITVQELGEFNLEESRTVRPFLHTSNDKESPLVLSGEKLVVFLRRGRDTSAKVPAWSPASRFGGMKVSAVWIADGHVYGFTQVKNPGPSILTDQSYSEDELEQRILSINKTRNDLRACAELPEAQRRAKVAARFVDSPLYYARKEAFRLLAECGDDALPHLRRILRDQHKLDLHDKAVKALGIAGGESVVPELIAMLEKELSFWRKTAPELKRGWWNGKGLEWDDVELLQDRYSVVREILYALRRIKSPACRSAVRDFRDYWRSLPQLEDKSGLDQMSKACDAVLEALPSNDAEE